MILVILKDKHITFRMRNKKDERAYIGKFYSDRNIAALDLKHLGKHKREDIFFIRVVIDENEAKEVVRDFCKFLDKIRKVIEWEKHLTSLTSPILKK